MSRPTLGAGVKGMIQVQNDAGLRGSLSSAGKTVLWAGSASITALADGDPGVAAGISAAAVLASTAYLTARAVAEPVVSKVVATVSEAVAGVDDMIPMIGTWLKLVIDVASAGEQTDEMLAQQCRRGYARVESGTGPSNEILPCDVFVAPPVSDQFPDASLPMRRDWHEQWNRAKGSKAEHKLENGGGGFWLLPEPAQFGGGGFADLLRMLEEDPPSDWGGAQSAKIAWPGAGLRKGARQALRQLRLGMTAGYKWKDPQTQKIYCFDVRPADGGACLWPVYADLLLAEWSAERMPRDWLRWRMICRTSGVDQYGNKSSKLGERFAWLSSLYKSGGGSALKILGYSSPLAGAKAFVLGGKDSGEVAARCQLWEERPYDQLEEMLRGWSQFVDPQYTQFQAPNIAPQLSLGSGLPVIPYSVANSPRKGAGMIFDVPTKFRGGRIVAGAALGFFAQRLLRR